MQSDWAQYIKMEYAYNLRKDLAKAKKGPSLNFYTILLVNYHREVYIILRKRMIKLVQSVIIEMKWIIPMNLSNEFMKYTRICDRIA